MSAISLKRCPRSLKCAAYSFYERRGYVCGHELEDWLKAEMEVDRQLAAAQEPKQTG